MPYYDCWHCPPDDDMCNCVAKSRTPPALLRVIEETRREIEAIFHGRPRVKVRCDEQRARQERP